MKRKLFLDIDQPEQNPFLYLLCIFIFIPREGRDTRAATLGGLEIHHGQHVAISDSPAGSTTVLDQARLEM